MSAIMRWGLVSNCWRKQLGEGAPLEDLLGEADKRGYHVIELRQTCLGEFESGDEPLPLAEKMTLLPEKFPGIRFNVAVCVPFLDPQMNATHPVFSAGKWAAAAVAGECPPHLRLVDLLTSKEKFERSGLEAVATKIVELTRSLIEIDGVLSIEHSRQPWKPFRETFSLAREQLGPDADRLRLCYDPCNLLTPGDKVDPSEVTAALDVNELSMVHFKQRRDGKPFPAVADGDIDWPEQLRILNEKHYTGPGLLEIEPHRNIWEYLEGSRAYLKRCGMNS
ncbi:MAG: sugar phosphate isomerase/epimerase [Planctomycetes bacterium]|nr:sugar phosphate isomerase/epimerase [Planctomycetota bacterium]